MHHPVKDINNKVLLSIWRMMHPLAAQLVGCQVFKFSDIQYMPYLLIVIAFSCNLRQMPWGMQETLSLTQMWWSSHCLVENKVNKQCSITSRRSMLFYSALPERAQEKIEVCKHNRFTLGASHFFLLSRLFNTKKNRWLYIAGCHVHLE